MAWCVRFAVQIISRTVKGTDGQRAFQRTSHPRAMPAAWREKILYLEVSKKKIQLSDKFLDGIFLSIKEGSGEFVVGTSAGCTVCRTAKYDLVKTLQIRSFSTALAEHPQDRSQMTNHVNPESQESNLCESMYDMCASGSSSSNQHGAIHATSCLHPKCS